LDMNVLMSAAVTGAAILGDYPEAAAVMVLFAISEALESRAMNRTRAAVEKLLSLAPDTALVLDDGRWREMDVQLVKPGAIILVRPGERIACDGVVRQGRSSVNQAPITGESMPVDKAPGDTVFAGTLNGVAALEIQVTAEASDSTLARIVRSVEEARGARAPIERFVDAFSRWYTPAIFLLAVLAALIPPLLFSSPWKASIYTGLVILVTGCPCALVISTAVSVVSGLAAAAHSGMLVKGGLFLEQGRRLSLIALDKTGTITSGIPCQTDCILLDASEPAEFLAAALASCSDHPVSAAIARHAAEAGLILPQVREFGAIPGQGICGIINGRKYYLGNKVLAGRLGADTPELRRQREALEAQGRTTAALYGEEKAFCLFGVADAVRESSRQAIRELHELGVKTVMLTGDNTLVAQRIAAETGIDDVRGELMPEDKLKEISRLAAEPGALIGMVGDGINDAPALARAQIGFAMARGGTDTAIETANVALMDDDLRKVPRFIRLSRATWGIMIQNIVFALGIKSVFLALTFAGQATMWMAVFADVGTTLIVVANALRILKK
ncbi:MAG: heavy metal translocating P-type ATPase, partial [Desulfovibrionaceae bacterium]|nr:heavy metal translocating P-type ATPase [Desulfovibrionaceae bacterium]